MMHWFCIGYSLVVSTILRHIRDICLFSVVFMVANFYSNSWPTEYYNNSYWCIWTTPGCTFCSSLGRLSSLGALSVAVEAEAPSLAAFWIWPWLTRFCRFSRAWASSRRRDGGQFAGCSTDRDEAWCSSRRREAEALAPPASAMAYCCTLITPQPHNQSVRARHRRPLSSLPT